VLYDAKVHGYSNATFHQKCDQVNGTVTLVTLKNGARLGGYNPDNWSGANYKNVPTAFLFSLTDGKGIAPQKFALKPGSEGIAIYGGRPFGSNFGGLLFVIRSFLIDQSLLLIGFFVGNDLILYLDSLPSSYSTPTSYTIPSNTILAGSQSNWYFENVKVFRVI